jgi:hypothetical protein
MFKLDQFKKIHEDGDKAIMQHPKGHKITIVKASLSKPMKKLLADAPLHQAAGCYEQGGSVEKQQQPQQPQQDPNPISQGFMSAMGSEGVKNAIKNVKNYADGGDVDENPGPAQSAALGAQQSGALPPPDFTPQGHLPLPGPIQQAPNTIPPEYQNAQGFKEAQEASNLQQSTDANKARALARAATVAQSAQADAQSKYQASQDDVTKHINATTQDMLTHQINENHWMESRTTGQRVRMAIGMALSGIGSGLSHQSNAAMDYINGQINRDIDSQKANLGLKQNLLSAYQKQFGDNQLAYNMTKATIANTYATQFQLEAAKAGIPEAQVQGLLRQSKLYQDFFPLVQRTAAMHMMQGTPQQPQQQQQGQGQAPQQLDSRDPASLINYAIDPVTGKPPSDAIKEKIAKEIELAKTAHNNGSEILAAFDQARNENVGTSLGKVTGGAYEPASILKMRALMLPLLHDDVGRVNEFEVKTTKDLEPNGTNSEAKKDEKRDGIQDFVNYKTNGQLAKAHGIDLSRFQSTAPIPPRVVKSNGKMHKKVPGGWEEL